MISIFLSLFFSLGSLAASDTLKVISCSHPSAERATQVAHAKKQVADHFKVASIGRCLPTEKMQELPTCPQSASGLAALDSRFPTAALFVHYTPASTVFLVDTLKKFNQANPQAVANILVSTDDISKFISDKSLKTVVDRAWVNIIPVAASSSYAKWTRDIFRLFSKDGKPVLFHLNYGDESDLKISDNTPCEISRQCGIPQLVHNELVGEKDSLQGLGIDSGGNLGGAPGGVLYRGVIATSGFNDNRDKTISRTLQYPLLTRVQQRNTNLFQSAKIPVADIDVSFLYIGHADEILSILKTTDPAPCDFVILRPSLEKALEILKNSSLKKIKDHKSTCAKFKFSDLKSRDLSEKEYTKIAESLCIDGLDVNTFMQGPGKKISANKYEIAKIENILKSNAQTLAKKISENSACQQVKIIEVPVLFNQGKSVLPNQVNLLELTPLQGAPSAIAARSFFGPFDQSIKDQLKGHGIKVHFVNDLAYATEGGDVHCATNEVRLCQ